MPFPDLLQWMAFDNITQGITISLYNTRKGSLLRWSDLVKVTKNPFLTETYILVVLATLVLDFHKTSAHCLVPTMNLANVYFISTLIYLWDKVEYIKK